MSGFLDRLLRGAGQDETETVWQSHPRLQFDAEPAAIYAVGDIHGRLDLLQALERRILADGARFPGEKWLLTLGDHIDRGPHSSGVIDHLRTRLPPNWQRIALCGNHELEMLGFLARPSGRSEWLGFGGLETLLSYGLSGTQVADRRMGRDRWRQLLDYWIPSEHVAWLAGLPMLVETPGYVFVHAGLMPGVPLDRQADIDLVGFRDDFRHDFAETGKVVVHGHQVRNVPLLSANRIAVDTGAYATGVLTAVRIARNQPAALLEATAPA